MAKISPEEAINNVIFHSFREINKIKSIESYLKNSDNIEEGDELISNHPVFAELRKVKDTPRYQEVRKAMFEGKKKELDKLRTQGSHADYLQPIVILIGDVSMIKENVLESIKKKIVDDEHYEYDLEIREIDSSELNKDFVSSLPKPKGTDGGLLVISDFSKFVDSYSPDEQRNLLISIMRTRDYIHGVIGLVCTGWRIIFMENSEDENKWWPYSCVQYFGNKNCLYSYFVE